MAGDCSNAGDLSAVSHLGSRQSRQREGELQTPFPLRPREHIGAVPWSGHIKGADNSAWQTEARRKRIRVSRLVRFSRRLVAVLKVIACPCPAVPRSCSLHPNPRFFIAASLLLNLVSVRGGLCAQNYSMFRVFDENQSWEVKSKYLDQSK